MIRVKGRWAEDLIAKILSSCAYTEKEEVWKQAAQRAKQLRLENTSSHGWSKKREFLHESCLPSALALHPEVVRILYHSGLDIKGREKVKEELLSAVSAFRAR